MPVDYEEFTSQLNDFLHPFASVQVIKPKGTKAKAHSDDSPINTLTLPLPDSKDAALKIEMRLDSFHHLIKQLQSYAKVSSEDSSTATWQNQVDDSIQHFLDERQQTLESATRVHKRELIAHLESKGFLSYQQSSSYLAKVLNLSRATIYNYLKEANSLTSIQVHQVDAFTDKKFAGNPAGVVLDADLLSDRLMKQITRELNVSETAFILNSQNADFRLRYFTPSGDEVEFSGHSTVGALYMIAHEKRLNTFSEGVHKFRVETHTGILNMQIEKDKKQSITVRYEAPKIRLKKSNISHESICLENEIELHQLNLNYPIYLEETSRDLFIVVESIKELENLDPCIKKLSQFGKQHNIVAFCFLTNETLDKQSSLHCRCFAPTVGIPEDPFTGSVQGGLAAYAHKYGLINKMRDIRIEQGHFMNRPGFVLIDLTLINKQYSANINAKAMHCFSTQIQM